MIFIIYLILIIVKIIYLYIIFFNLNNTNYNSINLNNTNFLKDILKKLDYNKFIGNIFTDESNNILQKKDFLNFVH